jgi:hypothetical protein
MAQPAKASEAIPAILRYPLLYAEPLFAFCGAIVCLVNPSMYTSAMTRGIMKSIEPSSQFIYTELAGGWLHFAFTDAVVFRLVDNVSAWRVLCMGMLLSDIAYCHSCAEALGGWSVWLNLSGWTVDDWTVTITTWPFVLARICIVLGIGLRTSRAGAKKKQ